MVSDEKIESSNRKKLHDDKIKFNHNLIYVRPGI